MARTAFKQERQAAQRMPIKVVAAETPPVEQPVSSADAIATESDSTVADGLVDEGYHTNHENKNSGDLEVTTPPGTDGGLYLLGRGVKSLVKAIQTLRDLGVENLGLPLPKIVVVGDQSTGKSSLIEGISEIKVPRNTGTCTRCPLEINLVESSGVDSQWTCKITLITKYYHDNELIERATKSRPLGPWREQDTAEKFHFATLVSKAQVEDALHRAQLAILNIGNAHEDYKMGLPLPRDKRKVKFSPNVIQLDISGPDLPNLSFYDLPGVINVPEVAHEEYLVTLVKNLVKEYINSPDCINLLAIPMTDDPANSSASQLIGEVKGANGRTIGVITKPDRFQKGESFEQWDLILNGEKYQVGFGYYVVKNNPDIKVGNITARREEGFYFSEEEPWSTMLSKHEDRFGTAKLVTALSQKLTEQIRKSLPYIRNQVERKAVLIQEKLRELPEPLDGNLLTRLCFELRDFQSELARHFDGGYKDCHFQREWHDMTVEFRNDMAGSYPRVILTTTQTPSRQGQSSTSLSEMPRTPTLTRNNAPISIHSDSDNEESLKPSPASRQRVTQKRPHPSTQSTPQKYARISEIPQYKPGRKHFGLDNIREICHNHNSRLPGEIDSKAIETMIQGSTTHWEDLVNQYIDRTGKLCETMVHKRVLSVFENRQNTQFYSELTDFCNGFLTKAIDDQRKIIKQMLDWELRKPMTLNEEALKLAKEKANQVLQQRRRELLAKAWLDQEEERTGKQTTGAARVEKMAKITDAQIGPDPYGLEIKAMVSVRGYYEYACYKFVDNVYASVDSELFMKCREKLTDAVKEHFRLDDPGANQRLTILLAANPHDEHRRAQLRKEMETISKAQKHLEGLTGDE